MGRFTLTGAMSQETSHGNLGTANVKPKMPPHRAVSGFSESAASTRAPPCGQASRAPAVHLVPELLGRSAKGDGAAGEGGSGLGCGQFWASSLPYFSFLSDSRVQDRHQPPAQTLLGAIWGPGHCLWSMLISAPTTLGRTSAK